MPFGEHQYSVDDKWRVIIPASFRDFIADGMVVTRGLEGCLYVFPLANWRRMEEYLGNLPIINAESRNFVRFFYSGASKANIDSAGRINIPANLRKFAGINETEKTVVIAGAPNRLEIWNDSRWETNLDEIQTFAANPSSDILQELVG